MSTYTNSDSIAEGLKDCTRQVADLFADLDQATFESGPKVGQEGAWTAGQHLKHLVVSTEAVTQGFAMPKVALRMTFGKPNRPGRSYEEVIERYRQKLNEGGRASRRYDPKPVAVSESSDLRQKLIDAGEKLARSTKKWKEEDLDGHLLPHPLLGKMTVREMLYFTIYHNLHHLNSLKERYL